jgi:ankyrin repeat protein
MTARSLDGQLCSPATIALLLAHGADANARTSAGYTAYPRIRAVTPLDLSERLGRADVSEILRRHGAERELTTAIDDFVVACARGDRATAGRLLEAEPGLMQRLSPEDRALATHVAQQNSAAGAELMLELGFDPNARGWGGLTPLHWAACRGNRPLVRALLARGLPPVDLGEPAGTPLHQALYHRWNPAGDYAGVVAELVGAGVPLPEPLISTGDAALDAAVERLRQGRPE